MFKKFFIGDDIRKESNTLIWTMLSGIVYSLQSLLFLAVIMSMLGETLAGVYSIGMMVAQQMLTVGKYAIRNYQVSDVHEKYSFEDYFTFRIITCVISMIITFAWIVIGGYKGAVAIVILSLTIYKMAECFSDVFEGLYQQKYRFDVSGKSQFVKDLLMIIIYIAMLVITKDLVISSVVLAVISMLLIVVIDFPLAKYFTSFGVHFNINAVKGLFAACFSLFISSFLMAYINNAPKYAITDMIENSEVILAQFNALFMPVFAVDLLAGFTMRIWITKMALYHDKGEHRNFGRIIIKQLAVIGVITLASMVFMYFFGGMMLSIIYGTDLYGHEKSNIVLMLAGGFVSVYTLFENVIIIYRHQHISIIINVVSAVAAAVIVPACTAKAGLFGATLGYLIATVIRAVGYMAAALYYMRKENKK